MTREQPPLVHTALLRLSDLPLNLDLIGLATCSWFLQWPACTTTNKLSFAPNLPAKAAGLEKPKIKVTQPSLALVWQANASLHDL